MLEYSLIKPTSPGSTSGCSDDKSYPFLAVTLDDEWPRPMVMRGAQAQGRPLLRPLRPRLRHPRDARPAAAHVPDPHLLRQQVRPPPAARPAVPAVPHREVLRARASARSTSEEYDRHWSRSCSSSSTATPTPVVRRLELADAGGGRASSSSSRPPGCATGSRASSKAIEKQQMVAERCEDLDVIGMAEDELEAAVQVFFVRKGRVVGRKGFMLDKVEDVDPRRAGRHRARGALRRPAARRARSPVLVPDRGPTTRRCTRSGCRRCGARR